MNYPFLDYLEFCCKNHLGPNIITVHGDCILAMRGLSSEIIDFVYIDPPYNTGKKQENNLNEFNDKFSDFKSFIYPVFVELFRLMKKSSVICVTLDFHEVHYAKVWLDEIFERDNFMGEIIWLSELGRTGTKNWSMKHQTTLIFKKGIYKFAFDRVPRIQRKAMKEGYAGDKVQHSVLTYTMSNTDPERVGYPCQKPLALVQMLMNVHANKGDTVLDCFAGSGTTGEAAKNLGMDAILIDKNPQSHQVMNERLSLLDKS
jgi:site-specific DNA-methyltransferase (adenine-specific)